MLAAPAVRVCGLLAAAVRACGLLAASAHHYDLHSGARATGVSRWQSVRSKDLQGNRLSPHMPTSPASPASPQASQPGLPAKVS